MKGARPARFPVSRLQVQNFRKSRLRSRLLRLNDAAAKSRSAGGKTSKTTLPFGPERFEQLDARARRIKPDGLALGRFRAHIPAMSTIVQCCGAEYRRAEDKFLVPHTGEAICTVCDATLESWCESTHVPSHELIERPHRKPE